jgi:hypothetical protein
LPVIARCEEWVKMVWCCLVGDDCLVLLGGEVGKRVKMVWYCLMGDGCLVLLCGMGG